MLVETRAPDASGASRPPAQPWSTPLPLAGIMPSPPLDESLWSDATGQRDERLEGLKKVEEHVAGVLEGLAPTAVDQIAQTRAARRDAVESAASRAVRREWNREAGGQSPGAFRTMLTRARSAANPAQPPAPPTVVSADSSPERNGADPTTTRAASGAGSATTAAIPPANDGDAKTTVDAQVRAAAQTPAMPAANAGGIGTNSAGTAASAIAPAPSAGTQRLEPAATAGPPSPAASRQPVANSLESGGSGKATQSLVGRPSAQRDADHTGSEIDNRAENVERILRVLRGSLRRERSTTIIRLDPPELGALRLELDLRKDVLALRMAAETPAAQDLLRDDLDALRRGLEAAGIRLERIEVQPLATAQDASPFGASAESGHRHGETSGEQSGRSAVPTPSARPATEPADDLGIQARPVIGPARLNIVV